MCTSEGLKEREIECVYHSYCVGEVRNWEARERELVYVRLV